MTIPEWMNDPMVLQVMEVMSWTVLLATCGTCVFSLWRWRRPPLTPEYVLELVNTRLAELVPLPREKAVGAIAAAVELIAPGRPLAVYSAGEPPFLVSRHGGDHAPGGEDALWIEVHRPRLVLGQIVRDRCGTLLPLLNHAGKLCGVAIVACEDELLLDERARGGMSHIAGMLAVHGALDELVQHQRFRHTYSV